jgi:hypothetical protein
MTDLLPLTTAVPAAGSPYQSYVYAYQCMARCMLRT